ncbi:MAG TPA: tripartite tricarboxylate transporter TctB family protein [Devosia sp.]|nr:tripartite tricarboxylate transporter TctB family protein [Devosia sp.]
MRLATGATFVAAGAFFGFFGLEYRLGSMRSMGPGMLPVAGGVLLLLIGATLLLRRDRASEAVQPFAWRTLSAVLGSVVVFALSVDVLGLAIAAPLLIFGAVIATGQGSIRLFAVLALVLTVGTSLVFPYLLGVPLKVLP